MPGLVFVLLLTQLPQAEADYAPPLFPILASIAGFLLLIGFVLHALAFAPKARPAGAAMALPLAPPAFGGTAAPAVAPPPPPKPYRHAPIGIHFPQVSTDFPDVWGTNEAVDIQFRLEDRNLVAFRQVPGLTASIDARPVNLVFNRGVATVRQAFSALGDKAIVVELKVKGEPGPRRSARVLKIVDYRTEIADVFTNFREEASRAITPIREDATPWEIYDQLTGSNAPLPHDQLREIVSCFEEAKYSNHPVTRTTYERMINAVLRLERVEL